MKSCYDRLNPKSLSLFYVFVLVITMFNGDPLIAFLSFIASVSMNFIISGRKFFNTLYTSLIFLFLLAIINPIISHKGETVLFRLFSLDFTLEALLYGFSMSLTIGATLFWFRSFGVIMTSDKIMYLFGRSSGIIPFIFSSTLRFISVFTNKYSEIKESAKVSGYNSGKGLKERIRRSASLFMTLISWSLDHSIESSDSLRARGYGSGKRTNYSLYSFTKRSLAFLIVAFIPFAFVIFCLAKGDLSFDFYPTVSKLSFDTYSVLAYISFAFLSFIPLIYYVKECLLWKSLKSKI